MIGAVAGWAVDLIRDGVSPRALKDGGNKAVRGALVRTAVAHQNAGRDSMEWQHLVLDPASRLGHQLRLRDGHRAQKPLIVQKALDGAWEAAWEWRSERGPAWTREQAAEVAQERADRLRQVVADADADLRDAERAVLAHAADEAERHRHTTPALPRAQMQEATRLGLTALRTVLRDLDTKGLLTLAERGKRGANSKRANTYALPDAEAVDRFLCRETRPVVPPGQTCSAPTPARVGAPSRPVVPPTRTEHHDQETDMPMTVTLTLTPQEQADVLDLLTRNRRAQEVTEQDREADVLPLRRAER